jgi:peptidoglycan/xylan/chitin deacetylase (PgdA/CDA1 family)
MGRQGVQPKIFFRNDDVRGTLDRSLIRITEWFLERGLPIVHAVEPANLTREVVQWLLDIKRQGRDLVEIMQHGYDHRVKNLWQKGEFGGQRTYEEQYADIAAGKELMNRHFGEAWFPAFNFPYAPYNAAAIRAVNDLGYKVFNSHYNPRLSRRCFYALGHLLRRGLLLGRHVSWHLRRYPGTRLLEVDVSVSFIRQYLDEQTSCEFYHLPELIEQTLACRHLPVVGILLHHRYHDTDAKIEMVGQFVDWALAQGMTFVTLQEVFCEWAPRAGLVP